MFENNMTMILFKWPSRYNNPLIWLNLMHGPHSFAVQCTMSENKITKSLIAFKHIAQSILILTMQKYFWKVVLDFFCQIVLMQLVLVHQMMTKQILIWFLHDKKWNIICTRDSNPSIKKSISENVQNFRI